MTRICRFGEFTLYTAHTHAGHHITEMTVFNMLDRTLIDEN